MSSSGWFVIPVRVGRRPVRVEAQKVLDFYGGEGDFRQRGYLVIVVPLVRRDELKAAK